MVRAWRACPNVTIGNPNTSTQAGTPSCAPIGAAGDTGLPGQGGTAYLFGDRGACSFKVKDKVVPDCSSLAASGGGSLDLPAGPCHVGSISGKCSDIRRPGGTEPIDGAVDDGWRLRLLARFTFDDPLGGDMTVIDTPMEFAYGAPDAGKLATSGLTAEALLGAFGVAGSALPPCTQMEVVDVSVVDPGGEVFARMGGATRP